MSSVDVLVIDLDGTITYTDTLHESILSLLRNKPLLLLKMPIWLSKGVAFFKAKVAENSKLDVTTIPYNEILLNWLKQERNNGKKIVLCSATNERIALEIADHLQLFDDVMASDMSINLKGFNKREALDKKYGVKGYHYAGNSSIDLEVWAGSKEAIIVNPSPKVLKKAKQIANIARIFPPNYSTFLDFFRVFRVYQWVKNLLIFVPLLAAHQFDNFESINLLFLAFISFSLCASSVYIINDLLDLESDRHHPRKRYRSFAAGKLQLSVGMTLAPILVGISFALGAMVGLDFLYILCLYFLMTSVYSLFIKRIGLIDCLTLASLFTLRIIAGAVAISVKLSFWLMVFSIFIFLSLALLKRYAELIVQKHVGDSYLFGRSYKYEDAPTLQALGISAGYISTLVLALFMHSENISIFYHQPELIWLEIPLLLYWISWVWLQANRGVMHDDPIVFAAKDKTSLIVAGLTILVFIIATVELNI